jgi:hypothetical protein
VGERRDPDRTRRTVWPVAGAISCRRDVARTPSISRPVHELWGNTTLTQHKQAPASVKNREAPCSPSAAAKGVVTSDSLCKARAKKSTKCLKCYQARVVNHSAKPRASSKHCRQCEDMSWARPADRPCRCGKRFAPEIIPRPEAMQSSAGFDNVVDTGRRLVGFCTVGEMNTRVATR